MNRAPRPEIRDQAKGRWRGVLPRLGVPVAHLDGKQHPCPICGGKDRFRFDDLEGNGTWFCNHCGAGNGMSLVMKVNVLNFPDAAAKVRELIPNCPATKGRPGRDDAKCSAAMREVWASSQPIAGTMAEAYLRHRGCWSEHIARMPSLRFAARLRAKDHQAGHLPALIAKVTGADGIGVNVHRTFLVDGRKAYRAMMPGPVPAGAAIRLGVMTERGGIAEGIETALHAATRFGVPCWSAVTAGGMEKWEPPIGVQHVDVFGDADHSYTGQAAAFALAKRLAARREPIRCDVHIPGELGLDWADIGMRAARAA